MWPASSRLSYHPPPCGPGDASLGQYSQAVDHGASLPPVVLLLPLLQPPDHFEQRALGGGRVPVGRPANVLEVLDYTIPILRLRTERLLGLLHHWVEDRLNEVSAMSSRGESQTLSLLISTLLCTLILLP